jgi:predicted transcriptional regulator
MATPFTKARLKPAERARLNQLADALALTRSDVIRLALRELERRVEAERASQN